MRAVKRIGALFAGVAVVLTLSACSGGSSAPEPTTAAAVQHAYESSFPAGTSRPAWLNAATFDEHSADTIRVVVQEHLTAAERTTIGRQVAVVAKTHHIRLTTVIVRDASGTDSNYFIPQNLQAG